MDKCTLPEEMREMYGGCCCECEHQVKIYYHPEFNIKRSMSDIYAYGCNVLGKLDGRPQDVVIFSLEEHHSTCEMFSKKILMK